ITKRAVQDAFANPRPIDMDLVAAQEARRFLDRVVGYKLSPLLSMKLARALSAGRVQSVAVRLIVEREREILAFTPEEYWKISAVLAPEGTVKVEAVRAVAAKPPKLAKPAKPPKARAKADTKEGASEDGVAEAPEVKPEVPEGAFLAELAEWAGQKFKASNQ